MIKNPQAKYARLKQFVAVPVLGMCLTLPGLSFAAQGSHLADVLPHLMTVDHNIRASQYDANSKKLAIWTAKTDWLPSMSFDGKYGTNKTIKAPGDDTNFAQNEEDFKLNQLIYDFGKTGAAITTAELEYQKSLISLLGTRQTAMQDGSGAYLGVFKARKSLEFARRNEKNVQDQVRMEEIRRSSGSGFRTDVLEAEAQLSGTKAKVTQAEGALNTAINTYKKEFMTNPKHVDRFVLPAVPQKDIPKTLEKAVAVAMAHNTDVLEKQFTVDIARQTIREKVAAFAPSIDALGQAKFQWDMSGTAGKKQEYVAQVEISYPFFDSFGDVASYKSAKLDLAADEERLSDQKISTEESVRNDWESLTTSRANAVLLNKQAKQLAVFLKLATKERQLGRKTLLEVLIADTNYINALDQSIAAEVEVNKAAYALLKDMGTLRLSTFTRHGINKAVTPLARTKEKVKKSAVVRRGQRGPVRARPQQKRRAAVRRSPQKSAAAAKGQPRRVMTPAQRKRMQQLQQRRMRMMQQRRRAAQLRKARQAAAAKKKAAAAKTASARKTNGMDF